MSKRQMSTLVGPARNNRILHVDGDSFFASYELALEPKLDGRFVSFWKMIKGILKRFQTQRSEITPT